MCIPRLKTCCFCFTTETGTKIIAWLQMIFSVVGIILNPLSVFLLKLNDSPLYEGVKGTDGSSINTKTITESVIIGMTVVIALDLIQFLLGLFLLIAVYKRNMSYVKIWIIISLVILSLSFIEIVIRLFLKIAGFETGDIVSPIVSFVIFIYFIWVVYSYYSETKSGSQDSSGNV